MNDPISERELIQEARLFAPLCPKSAAICIEGLADALEAALARSDRFEKALRRATYVAEHLFGMIDRETWRSTGDDDGQGHYEGDYRAEKTLEEIHEWAALAGVPAEPAAEEKP